MMAGRIFPEGVVQEHGGESSEVDLSQVKA